MSQAPSTRPSSSSNFQSVLTTALDAYEKKTKNKLLTHPLIAQLQSCDSPSAILAVLEDIIHQFDKRRSSDQRLANWLNPTVNVVYAFSATLSAGVSLVESQPVIRPYFLQHKSYLLVSASFSWRLETYTEVSPTPAMTDMILKIMVEVLSIFAIATKDIRQRRSKKYLKKLVGKNDIEDALKRLDTLTQEEARMAMAEILKVTHRVDDNVKVLIDDGKK
ncbi:hypothetical protein BJV74DRAFT_986494 [Russula compacta]|nr:hypothetical protein BJV74DRAFT_986494 [Russula compacta]